MTDFVQLDDEYDFFTSNLIIDPMNCLSVKVLTEMTNKVMILNNFIKCFEFGNDFTDI